jgi:hypothetical protein
MVNGSSQAIWQSKAAPSVQGRVFAVRRVELALPEQVRVRPSKTTPPGGVIA